VLPDGRSKIAKRLNLAIAPDSNPGGGHYFAAAKLSFAQAGYSGIQTSPHGVCGKPGRLGQESLRGRTRESKTIHPPTKFQEDWTSTALQQACRLWIPAGPRYRQIRTSSRLASGEQFIVE